MQDFVFEAAMAFKDSRFAKSKLSICREDAGAIAALVKGWQQCQEQVRIHRNKPMPGVLKPQPKVRKKRPPVAWAGAPGPSLAPPSPEKIGPFSHRC